VQDEPETVLKLRSFRVRRRKAITRKAEMMLLEEEKQARRAELARLREAQAGISQILS